MRLDAAARQYFEDHGTFFIENGGAYLPGISYDYTKKLHVAYTYSAAKDAEQHEIMYILVNQIRCAITRECGMCRFVKST